MHIVITRPKEESLQLIEQLIKLGHEVTHLPVIKIEKLETKKINFNSGNFSKKQIRKTGSLWSGSGHSAHNPFTLAMVSM